MKFDRNTVIGFVLLAALFFGFFYFNTKEQSASAKRQAYIDSVDKANKKKTTTTDTASLKTKDTSGVNTNQVATTTGQFQNATKGTEALTTIDNDLVKITFTN